MVALGSLWLPILLASAAVFVVTALLWMVSPHHRSDWPKVEDGALLAAIRDAGLGPGQYQFNQVREARAAPPAGPPGFLILSRPSLKASLPQSFLYNVLVSTTVAYLAGQRLAPGSPFAAVFSSVALAAILGYSAALATGAIWFGRTWTSVLKEMLDGAIYGVVTGAIFGALWPS